MTTSHNTVKKTGPLSEPVFDAERSPYALLGSEKWWRDRYNALETRGYRLRSRYHPDWKPSWAGTDKIPRRCEDSIGNKHSKTIDATRLSDGKIVCMKRITKDTGEKGILQYLTSEGKAQDPRNHCVPLFDNFDDSQEAYTEIIVMPLLREFYSPPFYGVEEVVDFVKQTLEGLSFIHESNVSHRDCSILNIMMDPGNMYPRGYHPARPDSTVNATGLARYSERSSASGVKYLITDFGISTRFEDGESRLVTGLDCQDKEVPELSQDTPYDPFAVDIFTLGNVYKKELIKKHTNLAFLSPLADSMTQEDPKARPTISGALRQFRDIVARQPTHVLNWKLKSIEAGKFERFYQDSTSLGRVGVAIVKRLLTGASSTMSA